MEYVENGAVMTWDESTGQYVSRQTGGVLPPKTAAAYFRGMLDGLVSLVAVVVAVCCFVVVSAGMLASSYQKTWRTSTR